MIDIAFHLRILEIIAGFCFRMLQLFVFQDNGVIQSLFQVIRQLFIIIILGAESVGFFAGSFRSRGFFRIFLYLCLVCFVYPRYFPRICFCIRRICFLFRNHFLSGIYGLLLTTCRIRQSAKYGTPVKNRNDDQGQNQHSYAAAHKNGCFFLLFLFFL